MKPIEETICPSNHGLSCYGVVPWFFDGKKMVSFQKRMTHYPQTHSTFSVGRYLPYLRRSHRTQLQPGSFLTECLADSMFTVKFGTGKASDSGLPNYSLDMSKRALANTMSNKEICSPLSDLVNCQPGKCACCHTYNGVTLHFIAVSLC